MTTDLTIPDSLHLEAGAHDGPDDGAAARNTARSSLAPVVDQLQESALDLVHRMAEVGQ